MERTLRVESRVFDEGTIEIWTIDREAARNALNRSLVREIGEAARAAEANKEVRAIILTGAGQKAFCAGADLKERRGMSEADIRDFLALYRTEFRFLDKLSKPTVAALNGAAFGGGLELALVCDLRVASPHARMGLTELSLGIIPGAGGTQRLTRLIGEAKAKELLLFSSRLDAPEALSLGIINHIAESADQLIEETLEWIRPVLTKAPIAVGAALEAVDAAMDLALEDGLVAELRLYERTLVSEDRVEALEAFVEKRAPRFKGR